MLPINELTNADEAKPNMYKIAIDCSLPMYFCITDRDKAS